jgi:hypothetical protein
MGISPPISFDHANVIDPAWPWKFPLRAPALADSDE